MAKEKNHSCHDRYDRIFIKNLDAMHVLIPFIMPHRCDNEAVLTKNIEIDAINAYLAKKNAENPDFKYTWFHVIAAALAKTFVLRPKMNWFISGGRIYEKRDIRISFNVKRTFHDESEEAIANLIVDKNGPAPIEQVHTYVRNFVNMVRKENKNESTTDKMNVLKVLPVFVLRFIFWVLNHLERHGLYPKSLAKDDPRYASIYISNLGSIKMNANYHHLYENGTNSFFCVIGEKKLRPVFAADGTYEMHDTLPLSLTIDERIGDGFYFGRSLKLLNHLLQNPELLDEDIATPVEFE